MTNSKILKLTKNLIKFPSTRENLEIQEEIMDFAIDYFKKENVFIKRFSRNDVYSLVINLKREKNPLLFLNGHLDVVPADKKDFVPKVKGNRLYGRGSGDMKGAVAVMMEVLRYFSKKKQKPSLGLMLTCDEEIGGANGVGYLLRDKKYKAKLAFIPDGGENLKTVVVEEKGVLHLKIKTFGKSAHGSKPWEGENAIDKLIKIYFKIRKIIPELEKREWKNSLNLGKIYGGEAKNKVPDCAEMELDIRLVGDRDRKKIFDEIKKIVKNYEGKIEIIAKGDFFSQNKDDEFIKKYAEAVKEELGKKNFFIRKEGASDARYFSEKNIPVIITKINCKNIHSKDEWMDIEEQEKLYRILIKFVSSI